MFSITVYISVFKLYVPFSNYSVECTILKVPVKVKPIGNKWCRHMEQGYGDGVVPLW
jgi:hypothetical protein